MKIIISLIVIMAVGLTLSQTKPEEVNENENLTQQENYNNLSEEALFQKYKLSNDYGIDFNVWKKEFGTMLVEYSDVLSNSKIKSDGEEIELKFEKELMNGSSVIATNFVIHVNNAVYKMDGEYVYSVFLFDLDESDNYKELYVCKSESVFTTYETYRIKKDGLELIYDNVLLYNNNSKQYIGGFAEVIESVSKAPILGYYIYENGEFKYIDRFLNGEKITDENGELNSNFKNEIFTVNVETSGIDVEDSLKNLNLLSVNEDVFGDRSFLAKAKIKFLKQYEEASTGYTLYDIEIAEDFTNTYRTMSQEQEITLPAGTVLKGVTAWSNAGGEYFNLYHN